MRSYYQWPQNYQRDQTKSRWPSYQDLSWGNGYQGDLEVTRSPGWPQGDTVVKVTPRWPHFTDPIQTPDYTPYYYLHHDATNLQFQQASDICFTYRWKWHGNRKRWFKNCKGYCFASKLVGVGRIIIGQLSRRPVRLCSMYKFQWTCVRD